MSSNTSATRREHMSAYPLNGASRGFFAGTMRIDLDTGEVVMPGSPTQPAESLGATKQSLGIEKYRSAVIYTDQPGTLKIDGGSSAIQLIQGVNNIRLDMEHLLEISSFMPREMLIYLGAERDPPIILRPHDFEFRRSELLTDFEIDDTFGTIELFPTEWNPTFSQPGAANGDPEYDNIMSGDLDGNNQGAPIVSNVVKKVLTVKNIDSLNFIVKGQFRQWVDNEWSDLDSVFGPAGTLIAPDETANFEIDMQMHQFKLLLRSDTGVQGVTATIDLRGQYRP